MTAATGSPRPRYRAWLLFACALVLLGVLSLAGLYGYLRATHRPMGATRSAPPAVTSISSEQAQHLVQELARHPVHSLTIKTDASDAAANRLAHQLYDALRNAQWQVDLSTDSSGPPIGSGLTFAQTGEAARPPYPDFSQDPYFYLPAAFITARIALNSETGQASGAYKLYLIVGNRVPDEAAAPHGYLVRAGARWLLRHLKNLRSS